MTGFPDPGAAFAQEIEILLMDQQPELGPDEARRLTDRIKTDVEAVWGLIKRAYAGRAWVALSYDSWDSYCSQEFGTCRIQLPREERAEVVASLRESGLSLRAIESATGVSKPTIIKDLNQVVNSLPPDADLAPSVTRGIDGKVYSRQSGPPKAAPARQGSVFYAESFSAEASKIEKSISRLENLLHKDTANILLMAPSRRLLIQNRDQLDKIIAQLPDLAE